MGRYQPNFATTANSTSRHGSSQSAGFGAESEKARPTDPSKQENPVGLQILVYKAMHSEVRDVREYCARTLGNCSTHPANRTRMYKAELQLKAHYHATAQGTAAPGSQAMPSGSIAAGGESPLASFMASGVDSGLAIDEAAEDEEAFAYQ